MNRPLYILLACSIVKLCFGLKCQVGYQATSNRLPITVRTQKLKDCPSSILRPTCLRIDAVVPGSGKAVYYSCAWRKKCKTLTCESSKTFVKSSMPARLYQVISSMKSCKISCCEEDNCNFKLNSGNGSPNKGPGAGKTTLATTSTKTKFTGQRVVTTIDPTRVDITSTMKTIIVGAPTGSTTNTKSEFSTTNTAIQQTSSGLINGPVVLAKKGKGPHVGVDKPPPDVDSPPIGKDSELSILAMTTINPLNSTVSYGIKKSSHKLKQSANTEASNTQSTSGTAAIYKLKLKILMVFLLLGNCLMSIDVY